MYTWTSWNPLFVGSHMINCSKHLLLLNSIKRSYYTARIHKIFFLNNHHKRILSNIPANPITFHHSIMSNSIPFDTESFVKLAIDVLHDFAKRQSNRLETEEEESEAHTDAQDSLRDACHLLQPLVPSKDRDAISYIVREKNPSDEPQTYDEAFQVLIKLEDYQSEIFAIEEAVEQYRNSGKVQKGSKEEAQLNFLNWLIGSRSHGKNGSLFRK